MGNLGVLDAGGAPPDDEEETKDWVDQIGSAILRQATATQLPTWEQAVTALNSRSGLTFDGTNDVLACTTAASAFKALTNGSGGAVYILTNDTSGGSGARGLFNIGGPFATSRIGIWLARVNTTINVKVANGSAFIHNKSAVIGDGVSLWTVISNATGVTVRRNGAEVASLSGAWSGGSPSASDPSNSFEVGGGVGTTYPWAGDVTFAAVDTSEPSAAQIAAVEGAIAAYYAVPLA